MLATKPFHSTAAFFNFRIHKNDNATKCSPTDVCKALISNEMIAYVNKNFMVVGTIIVDTSLKCALVECKNSMVSKNCQVYNYPVRSNPVVCLWNIAGLAHVINVLQRETNILTLCNI